MVSLHIQVITVLICMSLATTLHRRPTPVLLPGKSRGWRSLVGCGPWGRGESDMAEAT